MRRHIPTILLLFLSFNTAWFVVYSAVLGWQGLTLDDAGQASRVYEGDAPLANAGLALHMVAGALLTLVAPLQALPPLRRHWPGVHRRAGYIIFALALITGGGGLFYIAVQGTIGGWWMSLWFAIYGAAIVWSAQRTVYHARHHDFSCHFAWATRLVVLAVGSWIYRMHYALWYSLMDGVGSTKDLTGLFDRIQVVAFFVPYLLVAELLLRRTKARAARTHSVPPLT